MYRLLLCLIFAATMFSPLARAEGGTCPPGYYPIGGDSAGWSSCAPIPDADGDTSSQPPVIDSPAWKSQWIAIAVGAGAFGVGKDQPSRRKAEKNALAECKSKGGKACQVRVATYNQCAAIAGGSTTLISAWDQTLQEVKERSMRFCGQKPGNENCQIYYADCSYPVRIK